MITVVSGHRRSGTSMMMRALHASGMDILYNPTLEAVNPDENGYQPNPGGLYEVGFISYMSPKFLRLLPKNTCAIKILWDGLVYLPKGDWKIIFMERDPEEIEASSARVDKHILSSGKQSAINHPVTATLPFCCYRTYNQDNIDHVLGIMDARRDVEIIRVQYQDVIDNPVAVFERLKYTPLGKERLPIDVEKAAAIVDPDLRRERKCHDHSKSRSDGLRAHR